MNAALTGPLPPTPDVVSVARLQVAERSAAGASTALQSPSERPPARTGTDRNAALAADPVELSESAPAEGQA